MPRDRKGILVLTKATRRWGTVLAALCLALAGVMGFSGSASAAPPNCNHSAGPGAVVDAHYIDIQGNGAHIGAVQLCTQGGYYWAYVQFYAPMAAGNYGQAVLYHYTNGVRTGSWNCDASGGNDHVTPGQVQCWTPRIHRGSAADTFLAYGEDCLGTYPSCGFRDSWGWTHITA